MSDISILEKEKCTGCGACVNICPVGAITMEESDEGFLYPEIDKDKCKNCGLCVKSCACLNPKYENNKNPECFAFMADDEERMKSSSGAVFPVLAKNFIENGRYVCGAVWNNDCGVEHIVSNKIEDIERMRGSKYLQSNTKNCYKEIREILNTSKKVLFTGCPCQVAGLKTYLQKDYENLYCIDLICHGVPSPKVFKNYIKEEFLKTENEKWVSTNFRDKITGWTEYSITTTTTKNTITNLAKNDNFIKVFLNNLCLRKSCADCKFSTFPRQGDLTIGDFWGINKFKKNYDDKKGTSLVLINNKKGKYLSDILKNNAKLYKFVPIQYAINRNPNLIKSSVFHHNREKFFDDLYKITLKNNVDVNLVGKCDAMILNYWFAVNYGASLTCYGVQCLLEKLGLRAKVINYVPNFSKKLKYKNSFAQKFAEKYLNLTKECKTFEDFVKLNDICSNFVVGSDQVFEPSIIKSHHTNVTPSIYLLDFVKSNNRKLSYAASMGNYTQTAKRANIELFNHFIPQFDKISVREDDAKSILKDYFSTESTRLIDGAFHIPYDKLEKMTNSYGVEDEYVAYYGLPYYKSNWERNLAEKISKKLNLPLKVVMFNPNTSIEEWLAFIKNAKFVVSNSYHAIVFSIIFNVSFVQTKAANAQSRFETLFSILNTQDNSISEFEQVDFNKILIERNWNEINSNIQKEISKAQEWLKNALEKPVKDKSQYDSLNYLFIQNLLIEDKYAENIKLLANKDNIFKKYYRYKILSKILFGEKRKHYKQKQKEQKELVNKIRKLANV